MKRVIASLLLTFSALAVAQANIPAPQIELTNIGGSTPWWCVKPPLMDVPLSRHQQEYKAVEACIKRHMQDGMVYEVVPTHRIRVGGFVKVGLPILPPASGVVDAADLNINCEVEWGPWVPDMGPIQANGDQDVVETRTATVVVAPQNSGLACPSLTQENSYTIPGTPPTVFPVPAAPNTTTYGTDRVTSVPYEGGLFREDGSGGAAFRITCNYSHMLFEDPIVYPGQRQDLSDPENPVMPSHLHVFFGNASINGETDLDTLQADGGPTACAGGTVNASAYWIPAIITDPTTGEARAPSHVGVYYKVPAAMRQDNKAALALPQGLRMVFGKMPNGTTREEPYWNSTTEIDCVTPADEHYHTNEDEQALQDCAVGDKLRVIVRAPRCWDGTNLDAPGNHRSHVLHYVHDAACPETHPVPLIAIEYLAFWDVEEGDDASLWAFSCDQPGSPGKCLHGDYVEGWNRPAMESILAILRWGKDIHQDYLDFPLRKSIGSQSTQIGPFLSATTGEPLTGLTIANTDVLISKNDAANVTKESGGCTHASAGYYTCTFSAADTDTEGKMQVSTAISGAQPTLNDYVVTDNAADFYYGAPGTGALLTLP